MGCLRVILPEWHPPYLGVEDGALLLGWILSPEWHPPYLDVEDPKLSASDSGLDEMVLPALGTVRYWAAKAHNQMDNQSAYACYRARSLSQKPPWP